LAVPAYGTWDAGLTYQPNDHWRATLFGRNLTDENYWDLGLAVPWGYLAYGGEPRTYGIELSYVY
jgi:iron complex outermembrane receptor protein